MEQILNNYQYMCNQISDINEHLPILKKYGEDCEHITEMGIRYIVSSWAFLASKPKKMVCYDNLIGLNMNTFNIKFDELSEAANRVGVDLVFHNADVLSIEIEETDLLFIDTYHEYNQIKKELALHGNKAMKYLIFHDTTTFGEKGETFKEPTTIGIWPAIVEFISQNPHWEIVEKFINNNGLTVLKRNNGQ